MIKPVNDVKGAPVMQRLKNAAPQIAAVLLILGVIAFLFYIETQGGLTKQDIEQIEKQSTLP